MTKTRSTKRALLMSGLALLMCVSMLIGSTFAWFTDSVTSAGNKIQSGTLKLDLELYDTESKTWNSIKESKAPIFDYDLWEPGYTEVQLLKVENEGNLALKWMAKFVCMEKLTDLAKVIDVYVRPYGVVDVSAVTFPADRNLDGYERVGTVAEFVNTIETTTTGNLEAGEAAYLGIALKMQESAGNEYQGMDLGAPFDIQILATQLTSEIDSFDDQYDKDADFDGQISTIEALKEALKYGGNYELKANITNNDGESLVIAQGVSLALDTNGYNITNPVSGAPALLNNGELTISGNGSIINGVSDTAKSHTVRNYGTLTINGGNIGTFATSGAAVVNDGTATINGGNFASRQESNAQYGQGPAAYCFINNGTGTMTINDATVNGPTHGIFAAYAGKLVVNGGDYTLEGNNGMGCYVVYATGEGEVVLVGGTVNTNEPRHNRVFYIYNNGNKFNHDAVATDNLTYVATEIYLNGVKQSYTDDSVALVSDASSLQTALTDAEDGELIVLTGDISGNLTATLKPDVNVELNGNGNTFEGVLTVDGKSATYTTAGLTIRNVNFKADSITEDACIQLGDGTNTTRYTCNVTVENCTFDVPGAVGVKSYTGGDKNLTIINCTATEKAHSLAQLKGIDGVLIERCTVNSVRGVNFNNSTNVKVINSNFDVEKYAVRFGESSGGVGAAETYLIKGCTLKSANGDGDAAIVLRGTADYSTLTIENTIIEATEKIANTATGATVIQ